MKNRTVKLHIASFSARHGMRQIVFISFITRGQRYVTNESMALLFTSSDARDYKATAQFSCVKS